MGLKVGFIGTCMRVSLRVLKGLGVGGQGHTTRNTVVRVRLDSVAATVEQAKDNHT